MGCVSQEIVRPVPPCVSPTLRAGGVQCLSLSVQAEKKDAPFLHRFVLLRPSTNGKMTIHLGEGHLLDLVYRLKY